VRHSLKEAVQGKEMVMTATALAEFSGTLKAAGANEAARAARFLGRVTEVPDAPSARAAALTPTRRLGANDITIMGTGDQLGATTFTSDAKAVNAALAQGVRFLTFLHNPVSFLGR